MKKKNYKKWITTDTEDYPRERKKYGSSPQWSTSEENKQKLKEYVKEA